MVMIVVMMMMIKKIISKESWPHRWTPKEGISAWDLQLSCSALGVEEHGMLRLGLLVKFSCLSKKWSTFLSSGWLYIFFVLEFPQFWGKTRILFEKREFTIGDKRKRMAAYSTINWKIEIERGQIRWFNNKGHGLVSCYQKKVDKQHP